MSFPRSPERRGSIVIADREAAAARFVRWLDHRLTEAGRGDRVDQLEVDPGGRFWLGRLAPEEAVIALGLGIAASASIPARLASGCSLVRTVLGSSL